MKRMKEEPRNDRTPRARPVKVGTLIVGGGFPVSVQTMWKEPLRGIDAALLRRIDTLAATGCELLRFAVPDLDTADLLGALAARAPIPLVADIHFDYRIALRCLEHPIAKIRINPGNIGASWKVEEVVRKARDSQVTIRVGVNAGSLPRALRREADVARAMVMAAESELEILDRLDFRQVVVSLKSSDVGVTVEANRRFAQMFRHPLHLGVTEAGPLIPGLVKNALALSRLLADGVGDTLRVSLSDSPENEILAGRAILQQTGVREMGAELVSCPACGRSSINVHQLVDDVQKIVNRLNRRISVAVMGCPVNGPGEARHADIGVSGAGDYAVIFRKGRVVRKVRADQALDALMEEVGKL